MTDTLARVVHYLVYNFNFPSFVYASSLLKFPVFVRGQYVLNVKKNRFRKSPISPGALNLFTCFRWD